MYLYGDLIVPLILEQNFSNIWVGGFIVKEKAAAIRCVTSIINTISCKTSFSTAERSQQNCRRLHGVSSCPGAAPRTAAAGAAAATLAAWALRVLNPAQPDTCPKTKIMSYVFSSLLPVPSF